MKKKIMPIITRDELEADIDIIEPFLEGIAISGATIAQLAHDLRYGTSEGGKPVDFRAMMRIAYDYAYQIDSPARHQFPEVAETLFSALHDYAAGEAGGWNSLLRPERETPVITVGFTALARDTIMQHQGEISTSFRYLHYLTRMSAEDCYRALRRSAIDVGPYSFSRQELEDISSRDYIYLSGDLATGDIHSWVKTRPGFIPDLDKPALRGEPAVQ